MKTKKFNVGDTVRPRHTKFATFKVIDNFISKEGKEYTCKCRNTKLNEIFYFYESELELIIKGER